ncbi:MAG: hypothetical protein M3O46_22890, partial [Myxococcota bacterium]|nr:hypothetical protein [Myxococcota bacterium]
MQYVDLRSGPGFPIKFSNGHRVAAFAASAMMRVCPLFAAAACGVGAAEGSALDGGRAAETGMAPVSVQEGGSTSIASDGALSGVTILASGQPSPSGIAVDDTQVYWINLGRDPTTNGKLPMAHSEGQVMKCPIAGCNGTPSALAGGLTTFPQATPYPLVVVAGSVYYWTEDST